MVMQTGEEIHPNTHAAASHFCSWINAKAADVGWRKAMSVFSL